MSRSHLAALSGAEPTPFWLDRPDAPEPAPALAGETAADLAVVGGGYSGLWTALLAKERDPSRDVVLVEADRVGRAASGRNGGFCGATLTHGLPNGVERFPEEIERLERLGAENLDSIEEAVRRYRIDCDFRRPGNMSVATDRGQAEALAGAARLFRRFGHEAEFLDADAVRAEVHSPTYVGGLRMAGGALVDPARLAWGLGAACISLGVRIHERTPVTRLERAGPAVELRTPYGRIRARRAALATNAFPSLLRRVGHYVAPVYDYALMTEPLNEAQMASIGWRSRRGIFDAGNQSHYYRLSADDRILWGGYDAVYHYGSAVRAELEQRPETFEKLARHFFGTFPQLEGVRFTHAWGGAIDTCSRFCAFFGTALDGRVAYAAGFTGLGVGATRFGANVMLDLLSGERTELTELQMVRSKPVPFPPEPLRYAGIQLTRWSLARADRRDGRRNLWLRALDRLGLGFDS